jgi:hypothetical protein
MNKIANWWGAFEFDEDQTRYWEIGSFSLCLNRASQEWRIHSETRPDRDSNHMKVASDEAPKHAHKNPSFKRYVFNHTDSEINLTPMVADRPQVSRAETPFYLPPNEHINIYVSSPVWVRIEVGNRHIILEELPSVRLSDTWYGPNTREGELCYSSPTFCRTNLNELSLRAHRVTSPVVIHNHSKQSLLLDQFSIPLPYLSVYADVHGRLWTEEIVVKAEANHRHVVKQGKGPPQLATGAKLLCPPRLHLKANNIITLFYSLLTE